MQPQAQEVDFSAEGTEAILHILINASSCTLNAMLCYSCILYMYMTLQMLLPQSCVPVYVAELD